MSSKNNDLEDKANTVNVYLQEINDKINAKEVENTAKLLLRIPYNLIRPASSFRARLSFIKDTTIKKNIAYYLILSDFLRWIITRTSVYGTLKEMIIKFQIVNIAAIVETMTVVATSRSISFKKRVQRMLENKVITTDTERELIWLWDYRSGIHLYVMNAPEYGKYDISDYNRAILTARKLLADMERFYT